MAPPVRQTPLRALMPMLTALLTLLIGAASATAAPQATSEETGSAPAAASEVEGETFVFATDTTFAPFEFRDASGELVGIDIDLAEAIAESQGFEIEWRSLGFNAALQALSSNQADGVIAGMSITEERQEVYDFSDPYFTGTMTLAVNEGDEGEIGDWGDLEGKTLVVKTGSMSEEVARERQEQYGYEITALDLSLIHI